MPEMHVLEYCINIGHHQHTGIGKRDGEQELINLCDELGVSKSVSQSVS